MNTIKLIESLEYQIKQLEYKIEHGDSIDYQLNGLSMTWDEKQAYFTGQVNAMKNMVEDLKVLANDYHK